MNDIAPLFAPRSVAVVGASPDITKPGGRCLSYFRKYGFTGDVYAVNERYQEVQGVPCFPTLEAIGKHVDLIVLLVPAAATPGYIREAGALGIRAAVIVTSGFGEAGEEGARLQAELVEAARKGNVALLGPNSIGLIDISRGLTATFTTALSKSFTPKPGPIALVTQSGALGVIIFSLAQAHGIGVGKVISTGNEAVLDFAECAAYLADDPSVSLILGYVEGLREGRRLVEAARRAHRNGKVFALLSSGQSDAGQRAALSHTGALAGNAAVQEAAFHRGGILPMAGPQQVLDLAVALSHGRRPRGPRVGITSTSGGAGVFIADVCSKGGLAVPPLGEATQAKLGKILPSYAAMSNPVDYGPVYTNPDAIEGSVRAVISDPDIDMAICFVALTPATWMGGIIEERFAKVQAETDKPIIVAWIGGPLENIRRLQEVGVIAYDDPARAAEVATMLWQSSQPLPECELSLPRSADNVRSSALSRLTAWQVAGRTAIGEREAKELLALYGIPVVAEVLAKTAAEAEAAGKRIGRSLAVKAEADGLLHKSDIGAVRLNVPPEGAAEAFTAVIGAAKAAGISGPVAAVIQPMAGTGFEILAGLRYDRVFGPTITVGLGGVLSEVLADVTTELAPITTDQALAMLGRLRGSRLLGSFRGSAPRDKRALAEALAALSRLAADADVRIEELDINPILVFEEGKGCVAVDAAIVLGAKRQVSA